MIADNLENVLRRISDAARQAGRPDSPRLVGVTKKRSLPEISELVDAGLTHLAENRWEELSSKKTVLDDQGRESLKWHFIGGLQGRSLRRFYAPLYRIDSLADLDHARGLSSLAGKSGHLQDVLVEVNVAKVEGRSGILPESLDHFLGQLAPLQNLRVMGMMVMGPVPGLDGGAETRRVFDLGREIWTGAKTHWPFLEELSMGMSEDFEEGIRSGCTEVRIGRLLFEGSH